jgi:type I restriction enzyme S subunit
MKYGLTETTVEKICALFARFPEIEKAILYGSRAKGNFKTGSDIDLTLCGEALTSDLCSTIASALDDLLLPYTIDLSVFNELNHEELREHIERVGVLFYERANHGAAMKAGWQKKTLGQMCQLISGRHVDAKDYNTDSRGVAYLTGPSDFGPVHPIISKWTEYPVAKAKKGDILITVKGSGVGKINLLDLDEVAISRQLMAVRVTGANPKYVLSYLSSTFDHFQSVSTGAAIPGISREQVLGLEIAMPPLSEQQRIVGILDEAFESIATAKANAEKNLLNARALFESYLQSILSQKGPEWVAQKKRLEELCELIVDCEHKTAPTQDGGIPSIRTPNIGKGKLLLDGVYRVSEESYREWTRRAAPRPGDLILAREAPAGNVAVIPDNLKVCLGQRTVLIRPRRDVFEPEFLALLLLHPAMQQKFLAHSRGATVQHVNMRDIRALDIGRIPPIAIQRAIVSTVREVSNGQERLESIYQQKLAALEALKKSLLHQAFTGEL